MDGNEKWFVIVGAFNYLSFLWIQCQKSYSSLWSKIIISLSYVTALTTASLKLITIIIISILLCNSNSHYGDDYY